MSHLLKQSSTAQPLVFLMVDSTDHVTGKTGLSPTVTLSKNGGSFASPSGSVTEIANGWYKVAGNATDTGTLGPLIVHATGTAADPVDVLYEVVAFDPQDVVRMGLTALPNAAAEAAGGLHTIGTGAGQFAVNGAGAISNVVLTATTTTLTNAPSDSAGVTTLLSRLSAARAGYLDNLNVGGAVASQADINALNQSASRRVILTTVGQYERPESASSTYTVEARLYDPDGAATNATGTPTLTGTGIVSGSLAANISAATNPSTGVYRWTYTVTSGATIEQARFDLSAVMSDGTFPMSVYTQVADFVAATFTTADRSDIQDILSNATLVAAALPADGELIAGATTTTTNITAVYNRLGAPAGASVSADVAAIKADTGNLVTRITSTLFANITSLAQWLGLIAGKQTGNTTARTELRATGAGSGTFDETTDSTQAIRDRGDAAWTTGVGGGGGSGSGADSCTMTITDSGTSLPIADADVWISSDAAGTAVVAGTLQTDSAGEVTFLLDAGVTYYLWMQKDGENPIRGSSFVAVAD